MTVERREATSLLPEIHEEAGARFREGEASAAWPRHYGDPSAEYRAAVDSCAVHDRTYRKRWRIGGRDPARMLNGIVTNSIPSAPVRTAPISSASGPNVRGGESGGGGSGAPVLRGRAPYGLTLTAKGKMVSDHRLLRLAGPEGDAFLLDLPAAGIAGMEAHFERFLPPRFATVEDVSSSTGMLTVVGPGAAEALGSALGGVEGLPSVEGLPEADGPAGSDGLSGLLRSLDEGEFLLVPSRGGPGGGGSPGADRDPQGGSDPNRSERFVRVLRSGDLGDPGSEAPSAFDVIASRETLVSIWKGLTDAGCVPMGRAAWETLRIEGGRPAFGVDMDETTIPVEAGVHDRAIDYRKGCYTGQEVIVRIRDRGRVNRHLRRLLLGDGPVPARGTELFREDGGRPMGHVTSAVESPRFGRVVALGYVRREVEPPGRVRLGTAEGPLVDVRALPDDRSESGPRSGDGEGEA